MPRRPPKQCKQTGCAVLSDGTYCDEHKKEIAKKNDAFRESSSQRGYGSRWRKARKTYLLHRPLCVMCEKDGAICQATVVDHIIPHKKDQKLFWNKENWQPLCKRHHDIKTAKEDGGFGRLSAH